jgi:hypothetical protein
LNPVAEMLGFGHAPPGLDAQSMAGIHGLVKLLSKCQRLTHSCRPFWFVFLLGEGWGWGRVRGYELSGGMQ